MHQFIHYIWMDTVFAGLHMLLKQWNVNVYFDMYI